MAAEGNVWALVLAAGEGSRLKSLTTAPSGTAVPKQFCSLFDGPPLLHEALRRAQTLTDEAFTCAVVAAHHRRWWQDALAPLPPENIIVQPRNCGTAVGILLPLLHILRRDPQARVVLLPSDHLVQHETVLADSLVAALAQLPRRRQQALLLGLEPEEVDPELGYIVPGERDARGAFPVLRFVEKPSLAEARELIGSGALWNVFIVLAGAQALLELFRARIGALVAAMEAAVAADREQPEAHAVAALYEQLPTVDFSRHIVAGQEEAFRVIAVPRCGWSDLGTPQRVADVLRRVPQPQSGARVRSGVAFLSLAAQHHRLHMLHGAAGA
ncbi:MAG: sugar phosphate nucleotidyltransferase [Steroidobacteraceae bacterium]